MKGDPMKIIGKQFIDGERVAQSASTFSSVDAATGTALPYTFFQAGEAEVQLAVAAATAAWASFRQTAIEERAVLLETMAAELDSLGDEFVRVVMQESGLAEPRVRGERQRTVNQLRMFAQLLRRGEL